MKKLRVVMLGPSIKERGGMGSVATLILKATTEQVQMQHICTWDGELSQKSKLHMLVVFIKAMAALVWELGVERVDVVHIHVSERGSVWRKSILATIVFAFRKPVIMHAHGCEFHVFFERLSPKLKSVVCWAFQRCTYLIVLSDSWKDFYLKNCRLSPEQVIVMPNPIEFPTEISHQQQSEQLNFVFLGKINQRKGIFDLLSAFAQLDCESKQKACLTIAGSGELEQAMELVKNLKIDNQVRFIGWIDHEKRNHLLSQADAFVLPSYNEGLPMALLEAMSWGLPTIATPVGGIGEVLTHNHHGLLVEPGNVKQLAEAMQSLLDNKSLRMRLGRAARNRVSCLDLKYYSASLDSLYWSAIDHHLKVRKLTFS
jgi:glycosyltransferase involved in cell wall biosynthesis